MYRPVALLLWMVALLGSTQPPIQWVPGALSLGVRLITHHHLVPKSRIREAIHPLLNTPSWRGA